MFGLFIAAGKFAEFAVRSLKSDGSLVTVTENAENREDA